MMLVEKSEGELIFFLKETKIFASELYFLDFLY